MAGPSMAIVTHLRRAGWSPEENFVLFVAGYSELAGVESERQGGQLGFL